MLMASRAKAPVLSASQPAAAPAPAPGEEEAAHKREADAMDDAPSAKRARTVSEPEAAANALLEEMAAEHPVEQAPTDDEALQGAQQAASDIRALTRLAQQPMICATCTRPFMKRIQCDVQCSLLSALGLPCCRAERAPECLDACQSGLNVGCAIRWQWDGGRRGGV